MSVNLAVIGVGNMANAIISGILNSPKPLGVERIFLFDKISEQYSRAPKSDNCIIAESVISAIKQADYVLLSVKPQNYSEVLQEIKTVDGFESKTYISIGAGITSESVSKELCDACVIRVLPNLPMTVGQGVSVICKNDKASSETFDFVISVFESSGSVLLIDEIEMNRIIGVTSSSPAYVFKFINSIYLGAIEQGLSSEGLLDAICDVFIGAAMLLKNSKESPDELISRVCSKGGTTEQAMLKLNDGNIDKIISDAMKVCTKRADELGAKK